MNLQTCLRIIFAVHSVRWQVCQDPEGLDRDCLCNVQKMTLLCDSSLICREVSQLKRLFKEKISTRLKNQVI